LRGNGKSLEIVEELKKDKARKIALKELRRVGLEEHAHKYPAELLGGKGKGSP